MTPFGAVLKQSPTRADNFPTRASQEQIKQRGLISRSLRIYITRVLPSLFLAIVVPFFYSLAVPSLHCCAQVASGLRNDSAKWLHRTDC